MPSSVLICCGAEGVQSWKLNSSSVRQSSSLRFGSNLRYAQFGALGSLLAVATNDGRVEIRDGMRGKLIADLSRVSANANCLTFVGDSSTTLCAGYEDGAVRVWETSSRKIVQTFDSRNAVTCCGVRRGEDYIAYGSGDKVYMASLLSGSKTTSLNAGKSNVTALDWSQFRKNMLAAVDEAGALRVWDQAKYEQPVISFLDAHDAPVTAVKFSRANGLLLSSASLDKKIKFYDVRARRPVKQIQAAGPIRGFDFHNNGYKAAVATALGRLLVYDLRSGRDPIHVLESGDSRISAVAFRPSPTTASTSTSQATSPAMSEAPTPRTPKTPKTPRTPRSAYRLPQAYNRIESALISPPKLDQTFSQSQALMPADEESVLIPQTNQHLLQTPSAVQESPLTRRDGRRTLRDSVLKEIQGNLENTVEAASVLKSAVLKSRKSSPPSETVLENQGNVLATNLIAEGEQEYATENLTDEGVDTRLQIEASVLIPEDEGPKTQDVSPLRSSSRKRSESVRTRGANVHLHDTNASTIDEKPSHGRGRSASHQSTTCRPTSEAATESGEGLDNGRPTLNSAASTTHGSTGAPKDKFEEIAEQAVNLDSLAKDLKLATDQMRERGPGEHNSGKLVKRIVFSDTVAISSPKGVDLSEEKTDLQTPAGECLSTLTDAAAQSEIHGTLLRTCIEDALSSVLGDLRSDVRNMHLEIIRGFHNHQHNTEELLRRHSRMYNDLMEENDLLKAENRRLKSHVQL
mmetsp:Transcript_2178/g.6481  ORF Transcript_2178/g.6481 Transcript_2178/m.6481 type:complete len:746 (-) Transcript_2178:941-3178(-)